jgi:hypothetical protein
LILSDGSLDKVPVSKPISANNRLFVANLYMGTFTAGVNPSFKHEDYSKRKRRLARRYGIDAAIVAAGSGTTKLIDAITLPSSDAQETPRTTPGRVR